MRLPPEQDLENAPQIIIELTDVKGVVNKVSFENDGENCRLRKFNFTHIIQRAQQAARSAKVSPEKLKAIQEKRKEIEDKAEAERKEIEDAEVKLQAEEAKKKQAEIEAEEKATLKLNLKLKDEKVVVIPEKPEAKKPTLIIPKKPSKGVK